jgi:hypothetical protein
MRLESRWSKELGMTSVGAGVISFCVGEPHFCAVFLVPYLSSQAMSIC